MSLKGTYKEPFDKKFRGDEFGNNAPYRNGRKHRGQDWSPAEKTIIPAICDGKITKIFWSDVLGWVVRQKNLVDNIYIDYCHLAQEPKSLKAGDEVKLGQPVGRTGGGKNTPSGSASTGSHLHMAVSKKENVNLCAYEDLIDPLTLFKKVA